MAVGSTSSNTNNGGGIGLLGGLFLLFLGLKLTNNIDWSYWWVFSPIWIPIALVVAMLLVVGVLKLVVAVIDERARNKRRKRRY